MRQSRYQVSAGTNEGKAKLRGFLGGQKKRYFFNSAFLHPFGRLQSRVWCRLLRTWHLVVIMTCSICLDTYEDGEEEKAKRPVALPCGEYYALCPPFFFLCHCVLKQALSSLSQSFKAIYFTKSAAIVGSSLVECAMIQLAVHCARFH